MCTDSRVCRGVIPPYAAAGRHSAQIHVSRACVFAAGAAPPWDRWIAEDPSDAEPGREDREVIGPV